VDAESRVDVFLESVELLDSLLLGWFVTGYVDVYDRARGDVGGQQDGRELNLSCALVLVNRSPFRSEPCGRTNRLSPVSRTATPASTLPTVSDTSIFGYVQCR
jgi:hypothetical protein